MFNRPIIGFGYFCDVLREYHRRRCIELPVDSFNSTINNMRWEETEDGFEYVLIHSTEILFRAKLLIAAATYIELDGGPNPVPAVIVDWVFDHLDTRCQSFFLQHEIGHLKYKHLLKRGKTSKLKRDICEEYEADRYAAAVLGTSNAVAALKDAEKYLIRLRFARWEPEEFRLRQYALIHG